MVRADRSPLRVVCGVWGQSLGNQLDRHCAETVGEAHDKFSIRLTIGLVDGGSGGQYGSARCTELRRSKHHPHHNREPPTT